jgi:hypothetical protein
MYLKTNELFVKSGNIIEKKLVIEKGEVRN